MQATADDVLQDSKQHSRHRQGLVSNTGSGKDKSSYARNSVHTFVSRDENLIMWEMTLTVQWIYDLLSSYTVTS